MGDTSPTLVDLYLEDAHTVFPAGASLRFQFRIPEVRVEACIHECSVGLGVGDER